MSRIIATELYEKATEVWPVEGRHILAHQAQDEMVVYQAFSPAIAEYAVRNQRFGGPDYSFDRMSWLKPNFLWMMYRSGWAEKSGQERVLAIWLKKIDFEAILKEAVWSSCQSKVYESKEAWQAALETKEVRLQWDPDHDPHGKPLARKAIQLGLKGHILKAFSNEFIAGIEDITSFVKEQKKVLATSGVSALSVPEERTLEIRDPTIKSIIRLSSYS